MYDEVSLILFSTEAVAFIQIKFSVDTYIGRLQGLTLVVESRFCADFKQRFSKMRIEGSKISSEYMYGVSNEIDD